MLAKGRGLLLSYGCIPPIGNIAEVKKTYTNPDKKRVFVTHTKMDDGIAEHVVETVKSWGIFDEVLETTAGCTVTTHCGSNTIGVLFINDGGKVD